MSKIDLLQGTFDMLILRVLDRLSQLSKNTLKLGEGSVSPSLYRMEAKRLNWDQLSAIIAEVMQNASGHYTCRAAPPLLHS